jgi:Putative transposase DNA-binding domain
MRGRQPALELGWAAIAEEPAALIGHGGICEGGEPGCSRLSSTRRTWVCRECGVTHDRDVNAARNIRSAGRCPPSVRGNEFPHAVAEPSLTYCRWEAGICELRWRHEHRVEAG